MSYCTVEVNKLGTGCSLRRGIFTEEAIYGFSWHLELLASLSHTSKDTIKKRKGEGSLKEVC